MVGSCRAGRPAEYRRGIPPSSWEQSTVGNRAADVDPEWLASTIRWEQRNMSKVRPVMDLRRLYDYIETHTANSDVCAQKLREWKRQGTNVSVIDLKKAYLQILIGESLWPLSDLCI
ncbi:hypothetical protein M514_09452 [Trichuris suis]|uniref:Uncharacterized protein n=1 Tax=Trichuris suis TaxID=68888 RepID=A0A085N9X2_9BILA|nr:hypothetical protein M514_09452 [Trichuris suis]